MSQIPGSHGGSRRFDSCRAHFFKSCEFNDLPGKDVTLAKEREGGFPIFSPPSTRRTGHGGAFRSRSQRLRNGHLELDGNGTVTVEKHSWASADGSICSSPGPNSYSYSEGDDWQSRGQGFEPPQLHQFFLWPSELTKIWLAMDVPGRKAGNTGVTPRQGHMRESAGPAGRASHVPRRPK